MKIYVSIWFCLVVAIHSGECVVTDKEYANLPAVFELDNFDRCMLLKDEALYCTIEFHLKPVDPSNPSITWRKIDELNTDRRNYRHDNLRHGICIPLTCPNITKSHKDPEFKGDLERCYNKKYEHLDVYGTIELMHCQTDEPLPYDLYDITALTFFVVYIVFVLYASFYEGLARYKSPEEYEKITGTAYGKLVSCFSIPNNWYRLKTVKKSPEIEALKGVQGIRFYNMLIVIICHAIMMILVGPVSNTRWVEKIFDDPFTIFLSSGPFAVETFFLMASFLTTFNILVLFNEKTGREFNFKTMFWLFVFRFIRLTPPLAFIILYQATLMKHAARGPWWELLVGNEVKNCRAHGWTNLLYINNLVHTTEMCFMETWYMAVDMHGFILVLFILYFTVKKPKRLLWLVPVVWAINQGMYVKNLLEHDIHHAMKPYPENLYLFHGLVEYDGTWINTTAHTLGNMCGTLVGILTGYIFYEYRNKKIFTKTIHTILWWLMTFVAALAIIIFPGMWFFSENFYPTAWFTVPYYIFATLVFGVAIATGIIGFSQGVGWMARWCVEWSPTYLMGRITYSTYLVHYAWLFILTGSRTYEVHVNYLILFAESMEVLVCCMIGGLILTLLIELPVSAIHSTYLKPDLGPKEVENGKNSISENDEKQKKL